MEPGGCRRERQRGPEWAVSDRHVAKIPDSAVQ
jgi:hypothetical protein